MRPFFNRNKLFLIPLGIAAFATLAGFVVMGLWNALMPVIFHLGVITFWQALGLFILCKILFGFGKGGPGFRGRGSWMKQRWEERVKNMTPEEREQFKAKWQERCGHGRWGHHHYEGHPFASEWDKKAPDAEKAAE